MTDPDLLDRAIRTAIICLRPSNYERSWAKGSPAIQALNILERHVGETESLSGEEQYALDLAAAKHERENVRPND